MIQIQKSITNQYGERVSAPDGFVFEKSRLGDCNGCEYSHNKNMLKCHEATCISLDGNCWKIKKENIKIKREIE